MSTPNPTPADMARFVLKQARRNFTAVVAEVTPATSAPVLPADAVVIFTDASGSAPRVTVGEHVVPNIIKAIHAQPGITVRSWLGGRACGKPHQIDTVERTQNGVLIAFHDSTHPPAEYKPAYRWYVVDTLGLDLRYDTSITERALVPYQEV